MYQIQRLTHDHVADFFHLRLQALREAPSSFTTSLSTEEALTEPQLRDRIDGPTLSAIWGAWDAQGQLVACTGLMHQMLDKVQHKATVYTVYVSPSARGAGLARQLVQAAMDYARTQPLLRQLVLSVTAGNDSAHQLYLSLGFREYGREPQAIITDGVFHDQILMYLPLHGA